MKRDSETSKERKSMKNQVAEAYGQTALSSVNSPRSNKRASFEAGQLNEPKTFKIKTNNNVKDATRTSLQRKATISVKNKQKANPTKPRGEVGNSPSAKLDSRKANLNQESHPMQPIILLEKFLKKSDKPQVLIAKASPREQTANKVAIKKIEGAFTERCNIAEISSSKNQNGVSSPRNVKRLVLPPGRNGFLKKEENSVHRILRMLC